LQNDGIAAAQRQHIGSTTAAGLQNESRKQVDGRQHDKALVEGTVLPPELAEPAWPNSLRFDPKLFFFKVQSQLNDKFGNALYP
jgi:hypothetical protein